MRIRILILFIFAALLSGCASNGVLTLMHASKHTELIVPGSEAIQQEVAGRSFQPGKIYLDASALVKIPEGSADDFFLKLLRLQVEKGFTNADLQSGRTPAYAVNIVIEEMKFTRGKIIIPDPSILRVTGLNYAT